jgi:phage terminase large subunit
MAAETGFAEPPSDETLAEAAAALESEPPEPKQWVEPEMPQWAMWLRVTTNLAGEPVRHRVAFGGRGGAKSWTFAEEALIRGTKRAERVLCTREFQRSIRDSVHRLLVDAINRMGLGVLGNGFYFATDKEIRGANGTLFIFQGLHRNENGIKSLEGITICWVEEARSVSQESIDTLIPTIRQPGAEIWWSYNPKHPTDPVDKMFRGEAGPPPGSVIINVNWWDNPWFPDVLRRDMEYDARRDPDKYAHIWLGAYLQHSEAKVFRRWKIMNFETPADALIRQGADWGFAQDPTVLVQAFIGRWSGEPWNSEPVFDWQGRVLFVRREVWAVGCPVDELPALFAGTQDGIPKERRRWENPRGWPGLPDATKWKTVADTARPELIAYMKARGFNIEAAAKGAGSVEDGIEFLRGYDICVHPSCTHVADELTHYSYVVDKLTGEVLPKLADKDNHTIDALRYALEAVRKAGSGRVDYASAGTRVTMHGGDRALEAQMQQAKAVPAKASGGGAGWGSTPGFRSGVL